AEKSTQVIAENLKRFNHEPVVVTVADSDKVDYVNGIKVYYVSHSNVYWSYYSKTKGGLLKILWHIISFYNPFILKKLSAIITKEKPDVVHTNNLSEFSVGTWKLVKKFKIPLVHTLRDYSLVCPRATLFRRNDICRKKNIICVFVLMLRRIFSKYPDAVTGNSQFILDYHTNSGFFKNAKKYVVYNSLETEEIAASAGQVGKVKFGYIGHLSVHKGVEFLLKIFKERIDAELHVYGSGITAEYEDYLKGSYSSKNISFHGFVKTGLALEAINVLIVPSLWFDTLPRVIYEAYSYGIPVIASDRGGAPEIIENGKTGFIYNADSAEDLVKKIRVFTDNPNLIESMAPHCLTKARDFLPDKVIRNYIDIYQDISKIS
ncbi:MAG: glycosyltransferase family 4 protein, partial [Actinobacteria bacterium]|nr:glycosyltransferase family 4 protein [Actinomycetota bacterium]